MSRRERAVRTSVEKLDISREAKDLLVSIWREVDAAHGETVRDLKARLKANRDAHGTEPHEVYPRCTCALCVAARATDLRNKNWRGK